MNTETPPPDQGIPKEANEVVSNGECPICHSVAHPDSVEWIYCDECGTWYHEVCEGLKVVPKDENYICNSCRKKSKFNDEN